MRWRKDIRANVKACLDLVACQEEGHALSFAAEETHGLVASSLLHLEANLRRKRLELGLQDDAHFDLCGRFLSELLRAEGMVVGSLLLAHSQGYRWGMPGVLEGEALDGQAGPLAGYGYAVVIEGDTWDLDHAEDCDNRKVRIPRVKRCQQGLLVLQRSETPLLVVSEPDAIPDSLLKRGGIALPLLAVVTDRRDCLDADFREERGRRQQIVLDFLIRCEEMRTGRDCTDSCAFHAEPQREGPTLWRDVYSEMRRWPSGEKELDLPGWLRGLLERWGMSGESAWNKADNDLLRLPITQSGTSPYHRAVLGALQLIAEQADGAVQPCSHAACFSLFVSHDHRLRYCEEHRLTRAAHAGSAARTARNQKERSRIGPVQQRQKWAEAKRRQRQHQTEGC